MNTRQIIITDKWTPEMHSIVHSKGEQHTHYDSWKINLELEFNEETAIGYLEMYADHTFRLEAKTNPVATFHIYSDGSIDENKHAYIQYQYINLRDIAEKKMLAEKTFHVNIEKELKEAREQVRPYSDDELKDMLEKKEIECQEYIKAYREKREKEYRDREEKELAEKAQKEAEAAKIAAEKEEKRQARLAWAREHGSERLRKGLEQGYSCIKKYESELGYFILGIEYEYDRDDNVEDKDHACPPLEALNEVERLQGIEGIESTIVWLPQGLSELHNDPDDYNEPESGCGAVRVKVEGTRGYWYRKF